MEVISKEAAEQEVTKWLDRMDISQDRRDDAFIKFVISDITRAVQKGLWIFNDDETITQVLIHPLGENGVTKEIKYSNRYRIGDWHKRIKKVAPGDNMAMIFEKLSLLSGEPVLMFEKLEKKDYDLAANVAVFF